MAKHEEPHYVDAKWIMNLTSCGLTKARTLIRKINQEIVDAGGFVPCDYRVPRVMVLDKLMIHESKAK